MTATLARNADLTERKPLGKQLVQVMTTTDHKLIGNLYFGTAIAWFITGGIMALLIRSELAYPGQQVVNEELYNQLFTMHGTIMLLLFATPLVLRLRATRSCRCRSVRPTSRSRV